MLRLLVDGSIITAKLAAQVEAASLDTGLRPLDLLAEEGIDDGVVAAFLAHELAVPWADLRLVPVDHRLVEALPRWVADALCALPIHLHQLSDRPAVLYLAMDDPTDTNALMACSVWTGFETRPLVAATSEIRKAIAVWYEPDTREARPVRNTCVRDLLRVDLASEEVA